MGCAVGCRAAKCVKEIAASACECVLSKEACAGACCDLPKCVKEITASACECVLSKEEVLPGVARSAASLRERVPLLSLPNHAFRPSPCGIAAELGKYRLLGAAQGGRPVSAGTLPACTACGRPRAYVFGRACGEDECLQCVL